MGVFDFFKKRKKIKKKEKKKIKPKEKKVKKPLVSKLKPKKRIPKKSKIYKILKAPHITEKTTDLAKKNQYTFVVWDKAKKVEIKKAIEDVYGVKVTDVRVINVPPKRRRVGRTEGWKKGYKKAIVKVKEGQKIEIFPR